ncbi:MAG: hypothetical protein ABSE51_00215 [Terracidiphilus sp.]|jgi:hypothetical protein
MGVVNIRRASLFAILLFSPPMVAQMLPEAPKPHTDRLDWTLLAADAGARTLDTYSTRWALRNPNNHEMFLPGFVANHTPMLATFEGGTVTLDYLAARKLLRHHHKMARMLLAADALQVYPWAIRNMTMPQAHSKPY